MYDRDMQHVWKLNMSTKYESENITGHHLEDLGVDEKVILKLQVEGKLADVLN